MTRITALNKQHCQKLYDERQQWFVGKQSHKQSWDPTPLPFVVPQQSEDHLSLRERVNRQKELLIENTTLFLTIQYIWEKVCKLPSNHALYRKILGDAKRRAEDEEVSVNASVRFFLLKEVAKLNHSTSFFSYMQWAFLHFRASLVHFLFNRIIKYYANTSITTHLNCFQHYIKSQKEKDDFLTLRTDILHNMERCLTILGGSYTTVTKIRAPFGTIEEMVADELKTAPSNCGRTSKALYKEVSDSIIQTTLGGKIQGMIASCLLQLFIAPEAIVESLVTATARSAKDNRGYSHSMNLFFLDQLKQIAEILRRPRRSAEYSEPLSKERERQFSILIHQLMELLDKSNCKTVEELSLLVKGRGFWPAVQTRHLENWAISLVMEEMIASVSSLLQLVNEDKIDQLTWQLLKITNRSFLPETEVSVYQMKKTEDAVADTTKKILKLTIDKGISGALTSSDPCFGSFFLPRPIALGKKCFSSVRFLPNFFKPIPLSIMSCIAATFHYTSAAKIIVEFSKTHQFDKIPLYFATIELSSLFSEKTMDKIKDLFQSHALATSLSIGIPLLGFYWVYSAIHSRASARVKQLFWLSIQPNTYRCGLHHLLLIPYVSQVRGFVPK